jgi:hypothetical protein
VAPVGETAIAELQQALGGFVNSFEKIGRRGLLVQEITVAAIRSGDRYHL